VTDLIAADRRNSPEPRDAIQAAPAQHEGLPENEQVRVLEAWIVAGDTVPAHPHR
jgi:hypothetical protein